jgi:ribosomal protein L37E
MEDVAPPQSRPPAGWYSDPLRRYEQRFWDGAAWTPNVSSHGVQSVDAMSISPAAGTPATIAPQQAPNLRCRFCGRAPALQVTFHQGIGMVILHKHKWIKGAMCRDCGQAAYKKMQGETLATGWWGVISLFANIIYIGLNFSAVSKLKKLAPPDPPR